MIDLSDFESRYRGLTPYGISSFVPSTSFQNYGSPPRHSAHPLPVEIISEIFLYAVQADPRSKANLMVVCRRWHEIMLSTPGIRSQMNLYVWTPKKEVETFGSRWLLDVTVYLQESGGPMNPEFAFGPFMTVAQAASRWRSLALLRFPSPGEYKGLQIAQPLQHLETFKLASCCNLGHFLEPLMTAITTTVTPRLTVMEVLHPDAALYIVNPAHFHILSSLTTLRLICRKMENAVNILPYLCKVEIFEAHHLSLPMYSPSIDLPLIQTLRVLHLKSVSVQWMEDQIFPVLEECSIIFPHHADAIQSVCMPSCSILKYDSNNLRTLEHFDLPPLVRLEAKCGQWSPWGGTLQLAALHPIFATQSLIRLHLEIKCNERLLLHMLGLVPRLEELRMGLSSPHSLSKTFFMAFAAGGRNTSATIETSSQTIPHPCRELKSLHLHYKRWLRSTERKALIPTFGDIVVSHQLEGQSGFSLCLSFGEGPEERVWKVRGPVERFDIKSLEATDIGFSGPHGIVPLSSVSGKHCADSRNFTELEYLRTPDYRHSIDCFRPFHSLREVRAPFLSMEIGPNTPLYTNIPLFHTLEVLHVYHIPSSFLAGQTFHKLKRYKEENYQIDYDLGNGLLTEMPVCTRLFVNLTRLATFNLPQICELSVFVKNETLNNVWEKHIVVNSNLSGLRLLHFHDTGYNTLPLTSPDLIQILRSLPALETLIIDDRYIDTPYMDFFKAFAPTGAKETTGSNESSGEGRVSGLICPGLQSLQIQDIDLAQRPLLMPVLKDIVTLRSGIGFPLKSFTFYLPEGLFKRYPERKWELIGKDRSFVMEEVPAQPFRLDI